MSNVDSARFHYFMAENLAFMPAAVMDGFGENMATQVWLFGVYVASVSLWELSPKMGKNEFSIVKIGRKRVRRWWKVRVKSPS